MPPIFMHSYMVQHLLDQQYDLEAQIMDLNDQKENWLTFSTSLETSNGFDLFDNFADIPMEHLGSAVGLNRQWQQGLWGFMHSQMAQSMIENAEFNARSVAQANGWDGDKVKVYNACLNAARSISGQLIKQQKEYCKKKIAKEIDKKCKELDKQLHQFQKQKMIVDSRLQAEQQAEAQGVQQTNWGYSLGGGRG